MNMMRLGIYTSGFVVALAASVTHAAAFANGSFETPALTSDGYQARVDGSTLGGWTATVPADAGVYLVRSGTTLLTPTANDGSQLYTFNSQQRAPGGAIYQDFDTTSGTTYQVSFFAGRDGPGAGTTGINAAVTAAGSTTALANTMAVTTATTAAYTRYSFNFVATTTQSRLTFSDISTVTNSVDPKLDSVSVTSVPEPGTAMFSAAVLASASVTRRRRR